MIIEPVYFTHHLRQQLVKFEFSFSKLSVKMINKMVKNKTVCYIHMLSLRSQNDITWSYMNSKGTKYSTLATNIAEFLNDEKHVFS